MRRRLRSRSPASTSSLAGFAATRRPASRWLPTPNSSRCGSGDGPDDSFGPADFGSFRLHGAIDRIDVADGRALIRDYKLSAKAPSAKNLAKQGRLQLLYMLAAHAGSGSIRSAASTARSRPRRTIGRAGSSARNRRRR